MKNLVYRGKISYDIMTSPIEEIGITYKLTKKEKEKAVMSNKLVKAKRPWKGKSVHQFYVINGTIFGFTY